MPSSVKLPSLSKGINSICAPFFFAILNQGNTLEACSASFNKTTSSSFNKYSPKLSAIRFNDSLAPDVNTTPLSSPLINFATLVRTLL